MGAWIVRAWGWLLSPNGAVLAAWLSALATIGAGLIAWLYVRVTRQLARTAADQSAATREQTDITRRMFEASYRPYVDLQLRGDTAFNSAGEYSLRFVLQLHGQVPAIIRRFAITVLRLHDGQEDILLSLSEDTVEGRRAIYPAFPVDVSPGVLASFEGHQPYNRDPNATIVRIEASIDYWGAPGTEYRTRVVSEGRYLQWRTVRHEPS